jgi:caffeoyl-CoA O-methyltransferase
MGDKFTALTPELHRYIVEHGARRDAATRAVEEATDAMGEIAVMQTAPDQAALITLLVKAIGARRALEVGTFTGYGAIAIARGLPPDGELICCELDQGYAEISARNVESAGLGDRVEIRVGPALETLRSLPAGEPFDFAYIDADKTGYDAYYEECLARMRTGGLLMLDNTLSGGRVLEDDPVDDSARSMKALNEKLARDERIDVAMLGIADGVTLALKREPS